MIIIITPSPSELALDVLPSMVEPTGMDRPDPLPKRRLCRSLAGLIGRVIGANYSAGGHWTRDMRLSHGRVDFLLVGGSAEVV